MSSKVDNARIQVQISSISLSNYNFEFSGFQPDEKIKYVSNSTGETILDILDVGENTTLSLMSGVIGYKGDYDRIMFIPKNGEVFELTLPWGNEIIEHLLGTKKAVVAHKPK
jgi:hypothetical protein